MGAGRVAPATIVAGKSVVRGAEVSCGDENGGTAGVAPLGVVGALELEASAATEPIVEECGAECGGVHAVALTVEVTVSTSSTCRDKVHVGSEN